MAVTGKLSVYEMSAAVLTRFTEIRKRKCVFWNVINDRKQYRIDDRIHNSYLVSTLKISSKCLV